MMKKKLYGFVFLCFTSITLFAQDQISDTLVPKRLNEVIVIGKKTQLYQKQSKPLATVEEYLQQSGKVGMIKRGGYAWEPIINSMAFFIIM